MPPKSRKKREDGSRKRVKGPPCKKTKVVMPIVVEDSDSDSSVESFESDASMDTLRRRTSSNKIKEKLLESEKNSSSGEDTDSVEGHRVSVSNHLRKLSDGLQLLLASKGMTMIKDEKELPPNVSKRQGLRDEKQMEEAQDFSTVNIKRESQVIDTHEKHTVERLPATRIPPQRCKTESENIVEPAVEIHNEQVTDTYSLDKAEELCRLHVLDLNYAREKKNNEASCLMTSFDVDGNGRFGVPRPDIMSKFKHLEIRRKDMIQGKRSTDRQNLHPDGSNKERTARKSRVHGDVPETTRYIDKTDSQNCTKRSHPDALDMSRIFVRPKLVEKTRKIADPLKLFVAGRAEDMTEGRLKNRFPHAKRISIHDSKSSGYIWFDDERNCKDALEQYKDKWDFIVKSGGTVKYTDTYVHPLRLIVGGIDSSMTREKLLNIFPDAKNAYISKNMKRGCCGILVFGNEKRCQETLESFGEKSSLTEFQDSLECYLDNGLPINQPVLHDYMEQYNPELSSITELCKDNAAYNKAHEITEQCSEKPIHNEMHDMVRQCQEKSTINKQKLTCKEMATLKFSEQQDVIEHCNGNYSPLDQQDITEQCKDKAAFNECQDSTGRNKEKHTPIVQLCTMEHWKEQAIPRKCKYITEHNTDNYTLIKKPCSLDQRKEQATPSKHKTITEQNKGKHTPIEQLCTMERLKEYPTPNKHQDSSEPDNEKSEPTEELCTIKEREEQDSHTGHQDNTGQDNEKYLLTELQSAIGCSGKDHATSMEQQNKEKHTPTGLQNITYQGEKQATPTEHQNKVQQDSEKHTPIGLQSILEQGAEHAKPTKHQAIIEQVKDKSLTIAHQDMMKDCKKNSALSGHQDVLETSTGKSLGNERPYANKSAESFPEEDIDVGPQLLEASRAGNIKRVKALVASYPHIVNCQDVEGCCSTPLHLAAGYNHVRVVETLLRCGADVHTRDNGGFVPLHNACSFGHYEIARLLIQYGASVNIADSWKFTPLHEAAAKGHVEICKLLLKHGADTSKKNLDGRTPLELVRRRDRKLTGLLRSKTVTNKTSVNSKGSAQEGVIPVKTQEFFNSSYPSKDVSVSKKTLNNENNKAPFSGSKSSKAEIDNIPGDGHDIKINQDEAQLSLLKSCEVRTAETAAPCLNKLKEQKDIIEVIDRNLMSVKTDKRMIEHFEERNSSSSLSDNQQEEHENDLEVFTEGGTTQTFGSDIIMLGNKPQFAWLVKQKTTDMFSFVQDNSVSSTSAVTEKRESIDTEHREIDDEVNSVSKKGQSWNKDIAFPLLEYTDLTAHEHDSQTTNLFCRYYPESTASNPNWKNYNSEIISSNNKRNQGDPKTLSANYKIGKQNIKIASESKQNCEIASHNKGNHETISSNRKEKKQNPVIESGNKQNHEILPSKRKRKRGKHEIESGNKQKHETVSSKKRRKKQDLEIESGNKQKHETVTSKRKRKRQNHEIASGKKLSHGPEPSNSKRKKQASGNIKASKQSGISQEHVLSPNYPATFHKMATRAKVGQPANKTEDGLKNNSSSGKKVKGSRKKKKKSKTGKDKQEQRTDKRNDCQCGSVKNCKKWRKSKKVFNPKKLKVKGFTKGSTTEDVWQKFPAAVDCCLKEEQISSKPMAFIWFRSEKDCKDAHFKYRNARPLIVQLAEASPGEMADGAGITLHEIKAGRWNR